MIEYENNELFYNQMYLCIYGAQNEAYKTIY